MAWPEWPIASAILGRPPPVVPTMPIARPAILLLCLALAACSRAPQAGAPSAALPAAAVERNAADAVLASMDRFLAARSFHASMRLDGGPQPVRSEMDFVAPDRYRLQLPQGTQTIIGNTLYLEAGGKRQTLPLPEGTLAQWRNPLNLDERRDGLKATALGEDRIGGQPARKYRIEQADAGQPGMLYWIGNDGRPLRIVQAGQTGQHAYTVTIDYSRFDDPGIAIAAP